MKRGRLGRVTAMETLSNLPLRMMLTQTPVQIDVARDCSARGLCPDERVLNCVRMDIDG